VPANGAEVERFHEKANFPMFPKKNRPAKWLDNVFRKTKEWFEAEPIWTLGNSYEL
jgi:hypothetical protein